MPHGMGQGCGDCDFTAALEVLAGFPGQAELFFGQKRIDDLQRSTKCGVAVGLFPAGLGRVGDKLVLFQNQVVGLEPGKREMESFSGLVGLLVFLDLE